MVCMYYRDLSFLTLYFLHVTWHMVAAQHELCERIINSADNLLCQIFCISGESWTWLFLYHLEEPSLMTCWFKFTTISPSRWPVSSFDGWRTGLNKTNWQSNCICIGMLWPDLKLVVCSAFCVLIIWWFLPWQWRSTKTWNPRKWNYIDDGV